MKLQDVTVLYQAFRDYLRTLHDTGRSAGGSGKRDCFSEKLRGSVLVLDGFTGFTPVQMKVVKELGWCVQ